MSRSQTTKRATPTAYAERRAKVPKIESLSVPRPTLAAINIPISLNTYFEDMIEVVPDAIRFLSCFSDEPIVASLLQHLPSLDGNIDLDDLATRAKINRNDLRRLISTVLDVVHTEKSQLLVRTHQIDVVKSSLRVASDTNHPDWLAVNSQYRELLGFKLAPKSTGGINLNINNNTETPRSLEDTLKSVKRSGVIDITADEDDDTD